MRKNVKSLVHEPVGASATSWVPNDGRVFQASNSFVHACMDATMAMHALSAKIKELEKSIRHLSKAAAKPKAVPHPKPAAKPIRSRATAK